MEFHLQALIETLELGDRMDDIMTTMTDLYVAGDIGMTMPMLKSLDPKKAAAESEQGYAAFEQRIITDRNHVMAERAAPSLPGAMSSWPSAHCICRARKALSNCCAWKASPSRGSIDPLTPDADGPDIRAERPHRRRHDAAVKRSDDKKIKPPEQILAPDDGGDTHQLAVFLLFEINDDPEIEMAVVEAEHSPLWRGGQDGKTACRRPSRHFDRS